MSLLGDIAARWLADEENEDTDQAYADVKQAKKAKTVAEAVAGAAEGEQQISEEQALELSTALWTYADVGANKFLGEGYATSDEEKALLIKVTVPMAIRYVPADFASGGLKDLIPMELMFLGVVAMVYLPKHQAVKQAKAAAAAAAGEPEKEVHGEVTARGIRAVS